MRGVNKDEEITDHNSILRCYKHARVCSVGMLHSKHCAKHTNACNTKASRYAFAPQHACTSSYKISICRNATWNDNFALFILDSE